MPLNAAPLSPEQVRTIRRWIAEGASEDQNTTKEYILSRSKVRFTLRIRRRVPVRSYLILTPTDERKRRTLHTEVAPNTSPGQWHTWELKREPGWPRAVTVILTIAYAEKEPQGTGFEVTYRKYVKQDRSLRSRLGQ